MTSAATLDVQAEISTHRLLLSRGLESVHRPHGAGADIWILEPHHRDVEVSVLHASERQRDAMSLGTMIEMQLYQRMHEAGVVASVLIELDGYARDLVMLLPRALGEIIDAVHAGGCDAVELVAGFVVTVRLAEFPFVHASGATAMTADLDASGNPATRLWAKFGEESRQVRDGGIVLVWSHQLWLLSRLQSGLVSVYDDVVRDLVVLGSLHLNVAAFALLEMVRTSFLENINVAPPARIATHVCASTAVHQRLLWVPNQHATRPISEESFDWFRPPFALTE